MAADKPPRPLPGPDHLRIENPGTIGLLVIRWFEWEDWSAAAKLFDALQDAGRFEDAREVQRIVAAHLSPEFGDSRWRGKLLRLLMWDVFSWNTCCEQMTDVVAAREARLASELVNFQSGVVMTMPDGANYVAGVDYASTPFTGNPHIEPVQNLIAFAALHGFTPSAQSEQPVYHEGADGDGTPELVGTEQLITFRRITLNEDADDELSPDDTTDLYEPGPAPPGDAV